MTRLIPARAGKTPDRGSRPDRPQAHPRAGGENRLLDGVVTLGDGSSPRGRGKPKVLARAVSAVRLIPARAGKTIVLSSGAMFSPAHPRAGGENNRSRRGRRTLPGSSPRGRGKHGPGTLQALIARLIPARAGKTAPVCNSVHKHRAHPRAGGENPKCYPFHTTKTGSSPRGRGKRADSTPNIFPQRLIPARAGKTSRSQAKMPAFGAHPRAGGENRAGNRKRACIPGSSPRGRGKPRPCAHDA